MKERDLDDRPGGNASPVPGSRPPVPGAAIPDFPFPVPASPVPVSPPTWPRGAGYAHGMLAEGRQLFIAGQIGWDPITSQVVRGGLAAQVRAALENVVAVLAAAGAQPAHLVRLTWFVTDRDAYLGAREAIGVAYREVIGRHFPAMSVVVVAGLLEPGAEVEIEATAIIPNCRTHPVQGVQGVRFLEIVSRNPTP